MTDIEKQIAALRCKPRVIHRKTRAIYQATLRDSRHIRAGNFATIAAEDVERLYRLYDEAFFNGLMQRLLSQEGDGDLTFRVSSRMSSAGGKTIRRQRRVPTKGGVKTVFSYELAVSARLLFQTFQGEERSVTAAGLPCADRLEALQRIVEHEMIHLLELLAWRDSSCNRERFQRLAGNLFAHTAVRHELVTQREIAHRHFGIKVGDQVTFQFEGVRQIGIVHRITQRATVLVEDPRGLAYSDGKRYRKYYVPVPLLAPVPGTAPTQV
jgi:hypothetical protein